MSCQYVVCIAGLSQDLFDRAQAQSSKKFVPDGRLILKKHPAEGYSPQLAAKYIDDAAEWIRQQNESVPISIILVYVNHRGDQTTDFVDRFFPFALTISVAPLDLSSATDKRSINAASNDFIEFLIEEVRRGRRSADAVSHQLKDEHKTPLLLPVRNFRSKDFRPLLEGAFRQVGQSNNIATLLSSSFALFEQNHGTVFPGGNGKQRCFSDSELYFVGPGRNRHGYFRHTSKGHHSECVLAARSRLGGRFAHDFHFDCQPARPLKAQYPNCHDDDSNAKATHVNIAPNDYVI